MSEINAEGVGRVWNKLYGEIPSSVVDVHEQIKDEEWIDQLVRK